MKGTTAKAFSRALVAVTGLVTVTVADGRAPSAVACSNLTSADELLEAMRAEFVLLDLVVTSALVDGSTLAFDVVALDGKGTALRAIVVEGCDSARVEVGSVEAAIPVQREVDFADVPREARMRTLAVALAELVRTTRNAAEARALATRREELRLRELKLAAITEPVTAKPPERHRTKSTSEPVSALVAPGRLRLNGGALVVLGAWGLGQSYAGELGTSLGHSARFRWSLEASYARAHVETVLGGLNVQRWGLALGGDFGFSDAPGLLIGPRVTMVELLARGRSIVDVEEDLQSGPGAAVGARVSFEVPVSRSWLVRSTLDAGLAVWSMTFTAGGHDAFVYEGPQAAWGIGASWNP